MRGLPIAGLLALAAILTFGAGTAEAGLPFIHAHRGGTLETVDGAQVPARPEETKATFEHAAERGFVLELDVKLTKDDVPVVIHDASLERTTDCDGDVGDMTAAQLRQQCEVDLLGSGDNTKPM